MNNLSRRRSILPSARFLLILSAGILLGHPSRVRAFVTLDTSAGADSSKSVSPVRPDSAAARVKMDSVKKAGSTRPDTAKAKTGANHSVMPVITVPPALPVAGDSSMGSEAARGLVKPHFRNILFLSADNMLVYSYVGVLKAFEEFRVGVDLILVESKAVVVGAAWSMGYPASQVEARLLERPLSDYMRPFRIRGSLASRFTAFGPDPIQMEIPLGLQSLQAPNLHWANAPAREGDEYLHLSWMVAKLTHDAPGGPVEDLKETPRILAVQVADLSEEKAKVLLEGNLQSLLKAGLLPKDALRKRPRLWPHASGSLISGHAVMADRLPFTFDRLILIQPGRHLRPPALEDAARPWEDSLQQHLKARPYEGSSPEGKAVLRIELNPDAGFDPAGRDPKAWVDLGYTSTLRSMDVLMSTLDVQSSGVRPAQGTVSSGPNPEGRVESKTRSSRLPPPLGLNRLTVNPLASGGRQLLQDLVRKSVSESEDSTGDGPIADLIGSGYYSELDVEWVRTQGEEIPALVFDALEKSRLLFQTGANLSNSGEDLPDRGPEIFAGVVWSEPFYVPFRTEGSALMGGHRPGFAGRFMITPIHPVQLELGVGWKSWHIRYPEPPSNLLGLKPWSFRIDRNRTELFLTLYPMRNARFSTAIQQHEMHFPSQVQIENQLDPGQNDFQSTDFQETGFLGLGQPGPSGLYRQSLWLRYRNLNRVNLFGPVKFSSSSLESRIRVGFGDFRFLDQYYWSNQDVAEAGLFDFMEAGEVAAFSFQDDYFMAALRSTHFQNVQAEYAPTFGKFGIRCMTGGFRLYGRALTDGLGLDFTRIYWETQGSYSTPLGPLRAGLAGVQGELPTYFIRFGADLDLDPDGPEH